MLPSTLLTSSFRLSPDISFYPFSRSPSLIEDSSSSSISSVEGWNSGLPQLAGEETAEFMFVHLLASNLVPLYSPISQWYPATAGPLLWGSAFRLSLNQGWKLSKWLRCATVRSIPLSLISVAVLNLCRSGFLQRQDYYSEVPASECRSVEVVSRASGSDVRSYVLFHLVYFLSSLLTLGRYRTSRNRSKRTAARHRPYTRKPASPDVDSPQAGPSHSLPKATNLTSSGLPNCEVCLDFQQGEAPTVSRIRAHFKKCHCYIHEDWDKAVQCTWPECKEPMLLDSIGKHIRGVHLKAMKKQCDHCLETFSQSYSLTRHRNNNCCGALSMPAPGTSLEICE